MCCMFIVAGANVNLEKVLPIALNDFAYRAIFLNLAALNNEKKCFFLLPSTIGMIKTTCYL